MTSEVRSGAELSRGQWPGVQRAVAGDSLASKLSRGFFRDSDAWFCTYTAYALLSPPLSLSLFLLSEQVSIGRKTARHRRRQDRYVNVILEHFANLAGRWPTCPTARAYYCETASPLCWHQYVPPSMQNMRNASLRIQTFAREQGNLPKQEGSDHSCAHPYTASASFPTAGFLGALIQQSKEEVYGACGCFCSFVDVGSLLLIFLVVVVLCQEEILGQLLKAGSTESLDPIELSSCLPIF